MDRLVEVGALEDEHATELLPRLGEGAVGGDGPAVGHPDRRRGLRGRLRSARAHRGAGQPGGLHRPPRAGTLGGAGGGRVATATLLVGCVGALLGLMGVVPPLFVALLGVALNQPVGHPLATALEAAATLALSLLGGAGALRAREAPAAARCCLLAAALGLLALPGWPRAL